MTITFSGKSNITGLTGFNRETGNPNGISLVPNPTGGVNTVIRTHLAYGDALAGGSHRSELNIDPIRTAVGSTAWYWWKTYIPIDWVVGGNPTVIWQVHDTPDGGDPVRRPPLEADIEGDKLWIISSAAISGVNDNQVNRYIWSMPLSQLVGVWTDWVVNVTWNYTSGGSLSVWKNRRKIFTETGQKNCYNDVAGLYPKLGVYTPLDLSASIPSRTTYHQGLVVGDGAYLNYNDFATAAGLEFELEATMFIGNMA